MKHTPGPWFIWQERAMQLDQLKPMDIEEELLADCQHVIFAGTPSACTRLCIGGGTRIVNVEEPDDGRTEAEDAVIRLANARLISAAPDLLEACEAIDRELMELAAQGKARAKPSLTIIAQVRAAIAKATKTK